MKKRLLLYLCTILKEYSQMEKSERYTRGWSKLQELTKKQAKM